VGNGPLGRHKNRWEVDDDDANNNNNNNNMLDMQEVGLRAWN